MGDVLGEVQNYIDNFTLIHKLANLSIFDTWILDNFFVIEYQKVIQEPNGSPLLHTFQI